MKRVQFAFVSAAFGAEPLRDSSVLLQAPTFTNADALQSNAGTPNYGLVQVLASESGKAGKAQVISLLEHYAQSAAQDGLRIDDATLTAFEELKKQIKDDSEVKIKVAHAQDNQLLKDDAKAVNQAQADFASSLTEDAASKVTVATARQAHATCRNTFKGTNSDMESNCSHLNNWIAQLSKPATCDEQAVRSGMEQYFSSLETFVQEKRPLLQAKEKACADLEGQSVNEASTCTSKQSAFEQRYCEWRRDTHSTCANYKEKFKATKTLFDENTAAAQERTEVRKSEWAMYAQITCLIDILSGGKEGGKEDCTDLKVSTSHLDLQVPPIHDEESCDRLSDVTEYPGSTGFIAQEGYTDLHEIKQANPCSDLPGHVAKWTNPLTGVAINENMETGTQGQAGEQGPPGQQGAAGEQGPPVPQGAASTKPTTKTLVTRDLVSEATVPSKTDRCFPFDGPQPTSFTVDMWVTDPALNGGAYYAHQWNSTSFGWCLRTTQWNGRPMIEFMVMSGKGWNAASVSIDPNIATDLKADQEFHLQAVYDADAHEAKVFINGAIGKPVNWPSHGSSQMPTRPDMHFIPASHTQMCVGVDHRDDYQWRTKFNGIIRDFKFLAGVQLE